MKGATPSSAKSVEDGRGGDDGSVATLARVLVVDDESGVLRSLRRSLASQGFEVLTAESAGDALALLASSSVDVVLTDACMPAMTGGELLARIRDADLDCEVVIMSAHVDAQATLSALRAGAAGFIRKPFPSTEQLVFELTRAAELKRLRRARRGSAEIASQGAEMVGTSARMVEVFRRVADVAALPSPLVVQGERGTGRRLVASMVHRRSRRDGELVVAEARTASTAFARLASRARGGTLCITQLEEADELSRRRLVEHVRGELSARCVLSAEEPSLAAQLVASFPQASLLSVPPLRERERDVLVLTRYFVARHARRSGAALEPAIDDDALEAIARHPWPGNVAELEAAVEESLALSGRVTCASLPARVSGHGSAGPAAETFEEILPYAEAKQRALDAFTPTYLRKLMARFPGDVPAAARVARLEPASLMRLLRRYGDDG